MHALSLVLGITLTGLVCAQGCIIGSQPSQPRYVCFDGRTLQRSDFGLIWNAKRGCFVSSVPCCAYNATHYSYYPNPAQIGASYARCRHSYPFRLGEMQTH